MTGNLRIAPHSKQVTETWRVRLFLTLTLQFLPGTKTEPQFLQILLEMSLGSLIRAL